MSSKYRYKRRRTQYGRSGLRVVIISAIALFVVGLCVILCVVFLRKEKKQDNVPRQLPPIDITVRLLDVNPYSRPGEPLKKVRGVVVHYTANPGTDAMANRNYFNNLARINEKKGKKTYASSHFVIGLDGTIVQCIPTTEIAYASNERNSDTVSIECCHKKKNGRFTKQTYGSLVELTAYLCIKYDLTAEDVIRHYDVTGKNCPKYFVQHEDAWRRFLVDVENKRNLEYFTSPSPEN